MGRDKEQEWGEVLVSKPKYKNGEKSIKASLQPPQMTT